MVDPAQQEQAFKNSQSQNANAAGEALKNAKAKWKKKNKGKGGKGGNGIDRDAIKNAANQKPTDDFNLTDPISPEMLRDEIKAAVNLRYGGEKRGIQDAVKLSQQQSTNIDAWYQQYADTLKATQQASQDFATAMAGPSSTVGATPQTTGTSAEAQQAAQNRVANVNSMTDYLRDGAVSQDNYYAALIGNSGLGRIGWQMDEQRQRDQLAQDMIDLKSEIGDYKVAYKGELRDRERQYGLDLRHQAVEEAAFNADVNGQMMDAKMRQKEANQDFKLKYGISRKNALDGIDAKEAKKIKQYQKGIDPQDKPKVTYEEKYGIPLNQWKDMDYAEKLAAKKKWESTDDAPKNDDGKKNGWTKPQRREHQNQWNTAIEYLRENPNSIANPKNLAEKINIGRGVQIDQDILNAALYWGQNGAHLTKPQQKLLRSLGIKIRQVGGYKGVQ
jgi:hypothetical protein